MGCSEPQVLGEIMVVRQALQNVSARLRAHPVRSPPPFGANARGGMVGFNPRGNLQGGLLGANNNGLPTVIPQMTLQVTHHPQKQGRHTTEHRWFICKLDL